MTGSDVSFGAPARLVTRPFVMVTSVTFLFFLYVGVQIPLMPRLIEDGLGGSELDIGLNLAAFSGAAILMRPFLGPWGDRYGRRSLMVIGSLVAGVAVALMVFVDNRWMLLPLRGVAGMGEGALFVGAATLISDLAPAHRRAEAASYFSVAVFSGLGLGPILGEALIGTDSFDTGLLAAAAFAIAAGFCAFAVPARVAHPDGTHVLVDDGPQHLFHRAALRPGAVLALGMAAFATFNAFMPDHARDIGLGGSKWVFALYSGVCLVVRIGGAKMPERMGLARAVTFALVFLAFGLVALAAVPTSVGVYGGTLLIGLGMAFLYPALMATAANSVTESARARVIATFTMFFEVGTLVGGILFGAVAEMFGKRGGFAAGGVAAVCALWVTWRVLLPSARSAPAPAVSSEDRRVEQFTNLS